MMCIFLYFFLLFFPYSSLSFSFFQSFFPHHFFQFFPLYLSFFFICLVYLFDTASAEFLREKFLRVKFHKKMNIFEQRSG